MKVQRPDPQTEALLKRLAERGAPPGMFYYRDHYLPSREDGRNPYASPLLEKDLSGLPPATVVIPQLDVLADDGKAYAERLKEAGVPVTRLT